MTPEADDWPPISRRIWDAKYRFKAPDGSPIDRSIEDTFARVANAAAGAEPRRRREHWAGKFADAMAGFGFLPAGRILAGAGTGRAVTLFNCFVMGEIGDDLTSIFDNVKEAALTMQQGGGIGHDFSTLRPQGAAVAGVGADASGPVSFMNVWDAMCRTIMSAGQRRGAMMATLACDHPDIEQFIDAKRDPALLRNFNLSVLVTDAFVEAVKADRPWQLRFGGKVVRTVPARALWDRLMRATYDCAEPGVIFIDRVNRLNNLGYCEEIRATNPCGEQPLPAHGACLLGSINLARLVEKPFTAGATIDSARLERLAATAVRCLDDVIDVSGYPLPAQRREAHAKRRIGLGITGLADALIQTGLTYGTPEAAAACARWMAAIRHAAYEASIELAAEKKAFPAFDAEPYLAAPGIRALPQSLRRAIGRHGIRNGLLTSIAPTGTISMLAGNVSSGIEPVFDLVYRRRLLGPGGEASEEFVEDYAHRVFRALKGSAAPLPAAFVTVAALSPRAHLEMQAAVQPHVDSAISKTINCPADIPFEAFRDVYLDAHALGLKGCTTYRPNAVTGSVLSPGADAPANPRDAEAKAPASAPVQAGVPDRRDAAGETAVALKIADRRGDIVYLAQPLERDDMLSGQTYKLRWPASDHAMYITINDIERDGRPRPFEIFINSKNLEHYAWTLALTRMISAVFRRGGDVAFVAEELKAVFDPQGGQWLGGRYVPSLLAAIGEVIEAHLRAINGAPVDAIGVLPASQAAQSGSPAAGDPAASAHAQSRPHPRPPVHPSGRAGERAPAATGRNSARACPRCGVRDLIHAEGCWSCRNCGFSKCG